MMASAHRQLPSAIARPHLGLRPAGHAHSTPGKRPNGPKRHIVTDMNGLLLAAYVYLANIQDIRGAVPLLEGSRGRFQGPSMSFANQSY